MPTWLIRGGGSRPRIVDTEQSKTNLRRAREKQTRPTRGDDSRLPFGSVHHVCVQFLFFVCSPGQPQPPPPRLSFYQFSLFIFHASATCFHIHSPAGLLPPLAHRAAPRSSCPFTCAQLILGENGEFWKDKDTTTSSTGSATGASRGTAAPRRSANGGGLPPPLSFSAPNAISKRVSYPYGGSTTGGGGSAEANTRGGGGGGGGDGDRRPMKRVASSRIAAKATVSNAFRR